MTTLNRMKDICEKIEDIVWNFDISYMDAIVYYCEENNIEVETFAKVIKTNDMLKAKIQSEAEGLNYLPKSSVLPI
jgi:predicted metallopeptidase